MSCLSQGLCQQGWCLCGEDPRHGSRAVSVSLCPCEVVALLEALCQCSPALVSEPLMERCCAAPCAELGCGGQRWNSSFLVDRQPIIDHGLLGRKGEFSTS